MPTIKGPVKMGKDHKLPDKVYKEVISSLGLKKKPKRKSLKKTVKKAVKKVKGGRK